MPGRRRRRRMAGQGTYVGHASVSHSVSPSALSQSLSISLVLRACVCLSGCLLLLLLLFLLFFFLILSTAPVCLPAFCTLHSLSSLYACIPTWCCHYYHHHHHHPTRFIPRPRALAPPPPGCHPPANCTLPRVRPRPWPPSSRSAIRRHPHPRTSTQPRRHQITSTTIPAAPLSMAPGSRRCACSSSSCTSTVAASRRYHRLLTHTSAGR